MRVLSVDPGTTTGFVLWEGSGYRSGSDVKNGIVSYGEWVGGWKVGARGALVTIQQFMPDVYVYEDFILLGGDHSSDREGLDPVRVNAVVDYELELAALGIGMRGMNDGKAWAPVVVAQTASQAKGVITDDRLKRWGLWYSATVKGEKPDHVRDACRHLCLYLRTLKFL